MELLQSCTEPSICGLEGIGRGSYLNFDFRVILFPWQMKTCNDLHICICHRVCRFYIPMMKSWNGNIFRVTIYLCGEFTGHGWIPRTKPVKGSFDVFFDLRLNKRLSKQWWGWCRTLISMKTPGNGNNVYITGPLFGESIVHDRLPSQKTRDMELWWFYMSTETHYSKKTIKFWVIWEAVTLMWHDRNEIFYR